MRSVPRRRRRVIASMKVPPKRKGNSGTDSIPPVSCIACLNESPSEKEGKLPCTGRGVGQSRSLNESPSEKEGKSPLSWLACRLSWRLNESPSEKEGKYTPNIHQKTSNVASMKVPPKRKGNGLQAPVRHDRRDCLNESPSEKEGKLFMRLTKSKRIKGLNESPSEKEGKCYPHLIRAPYP